LLAGVAPGIVLSTTALSTSALAVDVEDERTDPIATSTANAGAPDDVNVTSGGSIVLDSGVAITLDSDNAVSHAGQITISEADGATGVRILGGFTGSFDLSGSITVDEESQRTDEDDDGTLDGDFARGTGRTGILIEGASPFVGNINTTTGSGIDIAGNDSYALNALADVDGSINFRSATTILGDRNAAANIAGDVSGNVRLGGSIQAVGEDSSGVVVSGDVGGSIVNESSVAVRGFAFESVSNYRDPDGVFLTDPPPLDGDDLKASGPSFIIAGNVAEGFLNNNDVGGGDADDDADGNDPTKDISGDFDENRLPGSISQRGSAPAVLIDPSQSPTSGDIVIGLVVERIPDTLDDDGDGDTDEIIGTFLENYGFINRGVVQANGLNTGFDANAIVITGAADGRTTTVEGGFLNPGTATATAFEADATVVRVGQNATVPEVVNTGALTATINTETNHNVSVLIIEAGALVSALENSGNIVATTRGDAGNAVAIRDLSGTLVSLTNTGAIVAQFTADGDDDDGDGSTTDVDERTGDTIAVDLSGHSAAQSVIFVQDFDADDDPNVTTDDPAIVGDVRFGAGDDEFQLHAGTMTGDLSFAGGADIFSVDGGAVFTGALRDADGGLAVTVGDGEVHVTNREVITVTSVMIGDEALVALPIDLRSVGATSALIDASGAITIADGAQILPQIVGLGAPGEVSVEIMSAGGGLTVAGDIADALALESPFLFDSSLSTSTNGSAETVVVTIRRKTAEELGMASNQAALYEPAVETLNTDEELLVAIANTADAESFFAATDQLSPDYSFASFQFFVAAADGAIGAVGNRLDTVRAGRDGAGSAWMQEFGVYLDREAGQNDPGYRGDAFGIALGIDRPLGPFYAVGANVALGAASIEQPAGFDTPLSVTNAQLGVYAAAARGNLLFDLYAGAGADFFESERNIIVSDVFRSASGEWKGHHATATARLGYELTRGRWYARPALSVDYLRLDEESYRETGDAAVILALDERSADMLASTVSMTLGAQFGNEARTWWSPRLRLGYRYENFGSGLVTTTQFVSGGGTAVLRADDLPPAGGLFGLSLAAGSRHSSFSLDYDADIRDGFTRHGARLTFRFIF
jgi:uncharacterized protein with beta-barrel porin domain